MEFHVNHPILFVLAGGVILYVIGQSVFFMVKAWRRARELKIESKVLRGVAFGSALFTIAPAIGVLLGLISLSRFLGLPLPWLRLSVLGALTYELPAAASVAQILNLPMDQPLTDGSSYVAITWVMTLGIMSGILIILFFQKNMNKSLQKLKSKDQRWSSILMDSLFVGMIATFLGMVFADIRSGLSGWIPVFVMLFSAFLMIIIGLLIKLLNWKWLENYAMPFSMLGGMAFAIPLTQWIGA
ncbi:MAG: DUF5058 family protein [Eubacteriales bacterium]|nr:DUF5058 family protein [Eubacteriales bacterium]MDD4323467.1 DUF5058 family protein [Eubacteriales bacterium]MDD4541489.1 DUF5058 family protein [Eubacteriales bacterium]